MVELVGLLFIFIAGLFVGSFLNVVADRSPKGESPFKGRSHCEYCKENLKAKDLVPLLSYLAIKGKCRYCSKKLSPYYPISELITGLAFLGIASYLNVFQAGTPLIWINFAYMSTISSFLIIILLADIKYKIIPNKVVFPAIFFMLAIMIVSFGFIAYSSYFQLKADAFGKYLIEVGYWKDQMMFLARSLGITLFTSALLAGFFWFLIWVTKGKGMGGGDVKLAFLIGLINGFPLSIIAIVLAFLSGAIYSTLLMIIKRKGMKDVIPFGPFLILGSVAAFIFGQQIFNWYIGLL